MLVKPEIPGGTFHRGSGIYGNPFPFLKGTVTVSTGSGRSWDPASGSESFDLRPRMH